MNIPEELLFIRRKRLKVIHAAEGAECGLACLAMIGAFHGHDIDLNGLRQRYSLSLAGASLRNIISIADQIGLSSRALRVELSDLCNVQCPAILHWNHNHFVVLASATQKRLTIHDPARGRLELTIHQASKSFTGVVLELTRSETFTPIKAKFPVEITSLWSKLYGLESSVVQVLALSVALQVAVIAAPFQMQLVIDEALARSDANLLTVIAIGFGTLIIVQNLIEAIRSWTLQLLGCQMVFQMVGHLLHHLLRLPSTFFERRHVGDILSRLNSTQSIQAALTQGLIAAVIDGLMAILSIVVLFMYSQLLAMLVLAGFCFQMVITLGFYPFIRARTEGQLRTSAVEQTHLIETVRAATTIKLLGREAEREGAWRNLYGNAFTATAGLGRLQVLLNCLQQMAVGVQATLIVYLGANAILTAQGFSVGMLFAFISFSQTFTERASSLVRQVSQFRLLGVHLERLADIVTQEPEITHGLPTPLEIHGSVSIQSLAFRYGFADHWIFRGLSLDIGAGEFIAITGESGGGKTTLMKVLLGLLPPSEGEIFLDGHAAGVDVWRAWRSQVGVVAQDDRLLSGSLAENIAFFDPDLDMARVLSAAKAAQVHEDILRKPMQYQTLVGDMGSALSGGQRQRVLLARAFYRQPKIIVLDEGTANLDEATENAIAGIIAELPITRIVVAHRPALIKRADRVLRMEGSVLSDVTNFWRQPDQAISVSQRTV